MTDREEQLLAALAWMSVQYLECGDGLDHRYMSAGERATELLADYGLIDPDSGAGLGPTRVALSWQPTKLTSPGLVRGLTAGRMAL